MILPETSYESRGDRFRAESERLGGWSRALSWLRLLAAVGVLAFLFQGLLAAAAPPAWVWWGAVASAVVFALLALAHDRVIRRRRHWDALVAINRDGLARIGRRWSELPPAPAPPAAEGGLPAFARDLDLFGDRSLARLLGTARTVVGRAKVSSWLLTPAPAESVAGRQEAVAELAGDVDFRQRLEVAGLAATGSTDAAAVAGTGGAAGRMAAGITRRPARRPVGDPDRFLAWAEGEPWLLPRRGLIWTARLLPILTLGLLVAAVAGTVPASLAALALVAALIVSWSLAGKLGEHFDRIDAGAEDLTAYAGALAVAEPGRFDSPHLAGLVAELATDGASASRWMARLARRVEIADARHGSFHFVTQAFLLWDVHALWLLERWQVGPGRSARRWLTALGEIEALAALAALAHDEPEWVFPRLTGEGGPKLVARGLAHPLLAADQRVANDVEVGPPGSFLLVTGSNMSGKSTLLRSIGVNVVLAQAGGPVCATGFELPPVLLGTSVIVEDSLGDGVSFFMAELLRLKQVVDLAERAPAEGRTLLFLLDEVLRGTNNRERREALRQVMAHLVERGAIGAISTHDLELGDLPEIAAAAVPVHFRETINPPGSGGPPMSFDYRLRPGPATTTNALRLLEAVGLGSSAVDSR